MAAHCRSKSLQGVLLLIEKLFAPDSPRYPRHISKLPNDILTIPVNLAGVPGISIPCGFTGGLPLGLQIIGKHFDESTVYRVAHAFEQATDYHKQKPAL